MTMIRIEKAVERSRIDAGMRPRTTKYKGTEGRTTGQCCGSGWEYMRECERERDEREREGELACLPISVNSCICQLACELCTCWVSVWQRKRVLTLFTKRGDGCLPSVALLLLSSGHVYESQIIRSELRWAWARRNWLYDWPRSTVKSEMWPTVSASLKMNLKEP